MGCRREPVELCRRAGSFAMAGMRGEHRFYRARRRAARRPLRAHPYRADTRRAPLQPLRPDCRNRGIARTAPAFGNRHIRHGASPTATHLSTSITVEIVSPGPSRATIEARPERAADRAPAHGRTSLPTAPPPALIEAENRQVRFLAARISEALDEAGALEAETAALLEGDETYACLLTVPGIGPRTAAQLAVSVDIGRFPDHDHLASYCGIAPRVRSSGTSVRSVRASRRGDARLKSLLIFSCNSLVRSSGRYGEYYRACRARGMGHGRALKAVARKRLRAIYAVMRDRVPYRE